MPQTAIFAPVFTLMLLTLLVWVYMYVRRISFIRSNNFTPEQLTPLEFTRRSPPEVSSPSDNFKNLFEVPVIFYVLALYLFAMSQVDPLYVNAAWVFVGFRALHSVVHCTVNIVMLRFYLYLISTLAVWFMGVRAVLYYFGWVV